MILPPEERIRKQIRAYDQKAKKVLSIKAILAFILQECVFEFQGMARKEIEKCIGKTQISKVPVDQNTPLVQGVESEHGNQSDAYIRYDLLLYATVPGTKERIKLYINIEAQRTIPKAYPLLHRANVYVANGIAMQKGIEYTDSDYGKVKKCYSIWICMEAPDDTTAVNSYRFAESHIIGNHTAKVADYDLQTMVMIYLGKDHKASPMIELLWALFKSGIPTQELEEKLEDDFDIRLTKPQAKELNTMCNLGEGVYIRGRDKGLMDGRREGQKAGRRKGRKEGQKDTWIHSIRSLLLKGKVKTADEAIELLDIPQDARAKVLAGLAH